MSETITPTKGSPMIPGNRFLSEFYCPEVPVFNYEPSRWATLRSRNVEQMSSYWDEDSSRVYVLKDPKLKENELVVLCKEMFDQIITPLLELTAGRAALRVDISVIASNVTAIKSILEVLRSTLDAEEESPAASALQAAFANIDALEIHISKVTASVVMPSPVETEPSSLDDEERAIAQELLKEDEE